MKWPIIKYILIFSIFGASCTTQKMCFNPNEDSFCNCTDKENHCFDDIADVQKQITASQSYFAGKELSIKCIANNTSFNGLYTYKVAEGEGEYTNYFLYEGGKVRTLSTENYGNFKKEVKSALKKNGFEKEKIKEVLLVLDNMIMYR